MASNFTDEQKKEIKVLVEKEQPSKWVGYIGLGLGVIAFLIAIYALLSRKSCKCENKD